MEKFDEPSDFLGFSQDFQTSYENIICRLTFFLTFSFAPVGLCLHRPLWCCCLDTQIWRGGCTVHRHLSSQCSGAWSCIQSWVVIQQELPLYRQHETDLSAAVSASVLNVSQPFVSKNWMSNQMKLGARTWHQTSPVLLFKNQRSRRSPTQWGAAWRFSLSLSLFRQVLGIKPLGEFRETHGLLGWWFPNVYTQETRDSDTYFSDASAIKLSSPVQVRGRCFDHGCIWNHCSLPLLFLTLLFFELFPTYFFSYLWKCVVNPRFPFFFWPVIYGLPMFGRTTRTSARGQSARVTASGFAFLMEEGNPESRFKRA